MGLIRAEQTFVATHNYSAVFHWVSPLETSNVRYSAKIVWKRADDKRPSYEQLEKMHHKAHELYFIANSVRSEIVTEITAKEPFSPAEIQ